MLAVVEYRSPLEADNKVPPHISAMMNDVHYSTWEAIEVGIVYYYPETIHDSYEGKDYEKLACPLRKAPA